MAVSLRSGEVLIYIDKNLLHVIPMDDPINGIKFGVYGREEGFLIMNSNSGGIFARVLARQAQLNMPSQRAGPPREQDIPLKVPKKT